MSSVFFGKTGVFPDCLSMPHRRYAVGAAFRFFLEQLFPRVFSACGFSGSSPTILSAVDTQNRGNGIDSRAFFCYNVHEWFQPRQTGRLSVPTSAGQVRQSPVGRYPAPKVVFSAAFRCLFLFAPVRYFLRRISVRILIRGETIWKKDISPASCATQALIK